MSKRGCLSIFRRVYDVTQAMSKGGGMIVNVLLQHGRSGELGVGRGQHPDHLI